jgi:hypothetical protein
VIGARAPPALPDHMSGLCIDGGWVESGHFFRKYAASHPANCCAKAGHAVAWSGMLGMQPCLQHSCHDTSNMEGHGRAVGGATGVVQLG